MATDKSDLTYEQAKSALDEVIAKLEDKDLPLDEMVSLWEQGENLLKCVNQNFRQQKQNWTLCDRQ